MSEETEKGPSLGGINLGWIAATIAALLLGRSLPLPLDRSEPTKPAEAMTTEEAPTPFEEVADEEGDKKYDEKEALSPLREALYGEGRGPKGDFLADLEERLCCDRLKVHTLIATVPAPVGSSMSHRFDESVNSISSAAGRYGFVLERWRRPWAEPRKAEDPRVELSLERGPRGPVARAAVPSASKGAPKPQATTGDPGTLVFRNVDMAIKTKASDPDEFLVVFLVPESPTQGIDRAALIHALDLSKRFVAYSGRKLHLLAPRFSGSMPSLRDALLSWLDSTQKPWAETKHTVQIISGTASAFPQVPFQDAFKKHEALAQPLTFHSTTHRTETMLTAVLNYLGAENDPHVAILREGNTGFGATLGPTRSKDKRDQSREKCAESEPSKEFRYTTIRYPLNIAEIRRRYQKAGLLDDPTSAVLRGPKELAAPEETKRDLRDIFPYQTSDSTAILEDRVLSHTLRQMDDERYHVVGLISTDARDAIFLARLVRRHCPNARIFAIFSDLLYLESESTTDLRGMLVATTYPLYPANRDWTFSNGESDAKQNDRKRLFPSEGAQGQYNATIALLSDMPLSAPKSKAGDLLIEYRPPPFFGQESDIPPIWISVLGERALYPVACMIREEGKDGKEGKVLDQDYLWRPPGSTAPCERAGLDRDGAQRGRSANPAPTRPQPLKIDHAVPWAVLFAVVSFALLLIQGCRLRKALHEESGSRSHDWGGTAHFASIAGLTAMGYLFLASPLIARIAGKVDLVLTSDDQGTFSARFQWVPISGLTFLAVLVAAISLAPSAVRNVRNQGGWHWVELLVVSSGSLATFIAQRSLLADPNRLLSLDRSCALTGGVSAYVSTLFLMSALGAWAYARGKVLKITEQYSLSGGVLGALDPAAMAETLQSIGYHGTRLDDWFRDPWKVLRDSVYSYRDSVYSYAEWRWLMAWVLAGGLLVIVCVETFIVRPPGYSDEGLFFDWVFRPALCLGLVLFAAGFAWLTSIWRDLRATLHGFEQLLGDAFLKVPRRLIVWRTHLDNTESDYRLAIRRQATVAYDLLTGWKRNHRAASTFKTDFLQGDGRNTVLDHLQYLMSRCGDPTARPTGPHNEVDTIRKFAEDLALYRLKVPIVTEEKSKKSSETEEKTPDLTIEDKVIGHIEILLTLEAARWVAFALARTWVLVISYVFMGLALLFSITSYPFPEQPRVMGIIGITIAGLAFIVTRIAFGLSSDPVISRIEGTTPGRVSWDSASLRSLGTFVLPLLGVLVAISYELFELLRTLLGPILRVIH